MTEDPGSSPPRRRRFGRSRALAARLLRPPRSRRGLIVLVAAVGGIGSLVAIGSVTMLHWTETAAFCSQCHTMEPQVKAYELSPHRDVACGECHVTPGLRGWIKAKVNGARQTLQMVTGDYPRPIPTPDHAMLPSPKDTCMACHSIGDIARDGGPTKIVLRPRYRRDESSTRETVAVVVRPRGLGRAAGARGAHWHVEQQVEFTAADEHAEKIDWVGVSYDDGSSKEFIARSEVEVSTNARRDIDRLKGASRTREMGCIDCHNRVGHDIPSPERAVDASIASGEISTSLPYIKREAVARVSKRYPSEEAADRAIAALRKTYAKKYPRAARTGRKALGEAIEELQLIYRLVATPAMQTTGTTYASNLGHKTKAGCFRCHDGDHYEVKGGRVLDKAIPSTCTTCHTFPQVGESVSNVSLLGEPDDHRSDLWAFDHKREVATLDPAGTSCSACHGRSYCENCHDSGASKVTHDEMLYEHPTAIAKSGLQACAYCHQQASCARCHENPVLEPGRTASQRRRGRLRDRR